VGLSYDGFEEQLSALFGLLLPAMLNNEWVLPRRWEKEEREN
jgi:hypothetical protein